MNNEAPKQPNPTEVAGKAILEGIRKAQGQILVMQEVYDYQAKMIFMKFESAKSAGFSELQALEICTREWK